MNTRALLLSGLIAGVLMGILSEMPVLSILNCCLCLWIWAGGIIAVFLYRRFDNTVGPTTLTQGVLVGLVAGLVAAVLGTILAAIMPSAWQSFDEAIYIPVGPGSMFYPLPEPFDALIASRAGFSLFKLFTNMVFYAFFGVVGGMLGTLIFKGTPSSAPTTTV